MEKYLKLIRWDKPAGTLLLLWPPLWCLLLVAGGWPGLELLLCFVLGAFFMRSAGCIINDMTDRRLDAQVERTKARPLASGDISMRQAAAALILLLGGALAVAMYLGWPVVLAALPALPLVAAYPWMKRITFWPQLFLGITFNYGVILASVALTGAVQPQAWWLYAACIFWTLGYDTIYAFQDRQDDEKIGVKSTARLFYARPRGAVGVMYAASLAAFVGAGWASGLFPAYAGLLVVISAHFTWQICVLDSQIPALCQRLFVANAVQLGSMATLVLAGVMAWG